MHSTALYVTILQGFQLQLIELARDHGLLGASPARDHGLLGASPARDHGLLGASPARDHGLLGASPARDHGPPLQDDPD